MKDNKLDIIIPAFKAQDTIIKTLASIVPQTIRDDVEVTIVNDCCPNGDYSDAIESFSKFFKIKELKLDKNMGAGYARQYGVDHSSHEFVMFIDADDTFAGALSLEILRNAINEASVIKCVSSCFVQMTDRAEQTFPHYNDMVWVFGKIYRREFLEEYNIRFSSLRANEDTGFNTWIKLLCSTGDNVLRFIEPVTYYWHNTENSITRINNGQYGFDQCFCGWVDNMIYVYENVIKTLKHTPQVCEWICGLMLRIYYNMMEIHHRGKEFEEQDYEYAKKFYQKCYANVKDKVDKQTFGKEFAEASLGFYSNPENYTIIPNKGIREFLKELEDSGYDENHIYDIYDKMKSNPETAKLIQNNIECGVCSADYTERPSKKG